VVVEEEAVTAPHWCLATPLIDRDGGEFVEDAFYLRYRRSNVGSDNTTITIDAGLWVKKSFFGEHPGGQSLLCHHTPMFAWNFIGFVAPAVCEKRVCVRAGVLRAPNIVVVCGASWLRLSCHLHCCW
jgi:hypothetical protein